MQQILKSLVRDATSTMFQNKKLKSNATSAIAEVGEVVLCASNFALPTSGADCCAVAFNVNFNVAFCLISNFKQRLHMSSSEDILGCTTTKEVEEPWTIALTLRA